MTIGDRRAFILANTRLRLTPHAPEVLLHVADEAVDLWQKTEEDLGAMGLPPPFWAFAWAGGQALARYVLDHPEVVAGRTVLDFATGSGLVAIAAARAGARHVLAADIDVFSREAVRLNAEANGCEQIVSVTLDDLIGCDQGWETVLAGDICYEQGLANRVAEWLKSLHDRGATVLIGDPGRAYLPRAHLATVATYEVPTTRTLEDSEIKRSSVHRFA